MASPAGVSPAGSREELSRSLLLQRHGQGGDHPPVCLDYLVKDQHVYEKMSCALEIGTYVIYVRRAEDEQVLDSQLVFAPDWEGIRMEVRHFREGTAHYPVVHTFHFHSDEDALLHLQCDFLFIDGQEWQKTSAEVDENRRVYVIYAQPAEEGG